MSDLPHSRCLFDKPIKCSYYQIIGNQEGHGILIFKATNMGNASANFSFNATTEVLDTYITQLVRCEIWPDNGVNIKPKQTMNVTCVFDGTLGQGDRVKIDIQASTQDLKFSGDVYDFAK